MENLPSRQNKLHEIAQKRAERVAGELSVKAKTYEVRTKIFFERLQSRADDARALLVENDIPFDGSLKFVTRPASEVKTGRFKKPTYIPEESFRIPVWKIAGKDIKHDDKTLSPYGLCMDGDGQLYCKQKPVEDINDILRYHGNPETFSLARDPEGSKLSALATWYDTQFMDTLERHGLVKPPTEPHRQN